jgi:hypothetical protein
MEKRRRILGRVAVRKLRYAGTSKLFPLTPTSFLALSLGSGVIPTGKEMKIR